MTEKQFGLRETLYMSLLDSSGNKIVSDVLSFPLELSHRKMTGTKSFCENALHKDTFRYVLSHMVVLNCP